MMRYIMKIETMRETDKTLELIYIYIYILEYILTIYIINCITIVFIYRESIRLVNKKF
jgi:hypothetical protein